jgi:putative ABC transport system permease protein
VKFIDIIRLSFGNLRRNLLRTVLTVSGVVVGISTIVFLVSLGFGLQNLVLGKVVNLDALTLLTVNKSQKEGVNLDANAVDKFKSISGVTSVSPILNYPAQVELGEGYGDTPVYGVIPQYLTLEDIKTDYGSKSFSGDEAAEALISTGTLKSLGVTDYTTNIGKEMTLKIFQGNNKTDNIVKVKIIGVSVDEANKYVYLPLKIVDKSNEGVLYNSIKIKTKTEAGTDEVRKTVESMGYPTSSIQKKVNDIKYIFSIIQLVLGGFGMIALMVAAIGIFNTLTIALLERTHEIGIMKAIGGRNRDVALVFTAEASMIGFFGGTIGLAGGWLMGILINALINFVATSVDGTANTLFYTPFWFAAFVVSFALIVSTVAGIMPATRAAKLDPLEALRYE